MTMSGGEELGRITSGQETYKMLRYLNVKVKAPFSINLIRKNILSQCNCARIQPFSFGAKHGIHKVGKNSRLANTSEYCPIDLYLRLGTSGLKISKVILGAMSYGSSDWQDWILNEKEALPLLEHAYKVGLNTWDTVSTSSSPGPPILT